MVEQYLADEEEFSLETLVASEGGQVSSGPTWPRWSSNILLRPLRQQVSNASSVGLARCTAISPRAPKTRRLRPLFLQRSTLTKRSKVLLVASNPPRPSCKRLLLTCQYQKLDSVYGRLGGGLFDSCACAQVLCFLWSQRVVEVTGVQVHRALVHRGSWGRFSVAMQEPS